MAIFENMLGHPLVERIGWTLVHSVWQSVAVAMLLAGVLWILRRSGANVRYLVSCAALGLIVIAPAVTFIMVNAPVVEAQADNAVEALLPLPTTVVRTVTVAEMDDSAFDAQAVEGLALSRRERAVAFARPGLPFVVLGWLVGVFGLSLWHLGGWAQLQRLRRRMVRPVSETVCERLAELAEELGVRQVVRAVESALVQVPTVVGWVRPMILLPASALTGLTGEQLEALLAHELAHIRRYDYLVNMLQTIVEILGFYHPAVWWISHKVRAEREDCCDDLAVQVCGDRLQYARALTSMEEIRGRQSELAVAASGGSLLHRIGRVLGTTSKEKSMCDRVSAAISLLIVVLILAVPATLALTNSIAGIPATKDIESTMPTDVANIMNALDTNPSSIIDVRNKLNDLLTSSADVKVQQGARKELAQLAGKWLFSKDVLPGDELCGTYVVQAGDRPSDITGGRKVPYSILMEINGMPAYRRPEAGQKIKVVKGPFNARINRSAMVMDLYLQDMYVFSFKVGVSKAARKAPAGTWRVAERKWPNTFPEWTDSNTGKKYKVGDPDYPLGMRWIGLEGLDDETKTVKGFCIHGTNRRASIGTGASKGWIAMYNQDVDLLYRLLSTIHSQVTVEEGGLAIEAEPVQFVYAPKTLSFMWEQCERRVVLQDIAMSIGVPIVVDDEVGGIVTAKVNDFSLETALEIILAGTDYVAVKTPDYYLVTTVEKFNKMEGDVVKVEAAIDEDEEPAIHARTMKPISFEWEQDELYTVLQDIASYVGLPIMTSDDVMGEVTAKVDGVSLDEALEVVLAGTDYVVVRRPFYYLVTTAKRANKMKVSAPAPSSTSAAVRTRADVKAEKSLLDVRALLSQEPAAIIEARNKLNGIKSNRKVQQEARKELARLAEKWLFSKDVLPGDELCGTYVVKAGDTLSGIGERFKVPYEILMQINEISRPEQIKVGQEIKVIHGPFNVRIYRSVRILDLYLQGMYVRSFRVAIGKAVTETPTGTWRVAQGGKLIAPPWTDSETGKVYTISDPGYPLGSRWIALEGLEGNAIDKKGFAIHGTNKPESIGTEASRGCIRMHNIDVILLYKLLATVHSKVWIEDGDVKTRVEPLKIEDHKNIVGLTQKLDTASTDTPTDLSINHLVLFTPISGYWEQEPLTDVLNDLSKFCSVPIYVDEGVSGIVTANMNVPLLDIALDIVLAGTNYVVKKTPDYYLVTSATKLRETKNVLPDDKLQTKNSANKSLFTGKEMRVFHLKYANPFNISKKICETLMDTDKDSKPFLAVDPKNKDQIIASGTTQEIRTVEALIQKYDIPSAKSSNGYLVFTPISNSWYSASLSDVLSDLSRACGIPILLDEGLDRDVTAEVVDTSLDKALEIVLAGTNYVVKKTSDYYLVTTREKLAKANKATDNVTKNKGNVANVIVAKDESSEEAQSQVLINMQIAETLNSKIDSETRVQIENLIGRQLDKTSFDGVVLADLLSNESINELNKDKLIELLTQKGYLKILAAPKVLVLDKQQAKLTIGNDQEKDGNSKDQLSYQIDIRPEVKEDGKVVVLDISSILDYCSSIDTDATDSDSPMEKRRITSQTKIAGASGQSSVVRLGGISSSKESIETILILKPTAISIDADSIVVEEEHAKAKTLRAASVERLKALGLALVMFADEHEGKFPEMLGQVKPYCQKEDYVWVNDFVRYVGVEMKRADGPDVPLAIDQDLLETAGGTNVVFADGHVEFVKREQLKKLGIGVAAIQIEARFLEVTDEFIEDLGLDANMPGEVKAIANVSKGEPDKQGTQHVLLDEMSVNLLLRATQKDDGAKVLAAPRVMVLDGERAEISTIQEIPVFKGFKEPEKPGGKPVPEHDLTWAGMKLNVRPILTEDEERAYLETGVEFRSLLGYEDLVYKKYEYKTPLFETTEIRTYMMVPLGKTMLIYGRKVRQWSGIAVEKDKPATSLLILITADVPSNQ